MASDFDFQLGISTENAQKEINSFSKRISDFFSGIGKKSIQLDTSKAKKEIDDLAGSITDTLTKVKGINIPTDGIKNLAKEFDNVNQSAKNSMRDQKAALAQLVATGQKGSKEFNDIQKQLVENAQAAMKFEAALKDVDDEIDKLSGKSVKIDMPESGGGMLGGLGGGALALGGIGAAAAGLGAIVEQATATQDAIAKVGAQTGLTGDALAAMTDRGKSLYQSGIGESIADAIQKTGLLQKTLGDTFSGKEQEQFAIVAQGIAKTYDMDFNEVIQKSRTFIKSFGLEGKEAMDLIAIGARDGANAEGDFFDTLNEYSPLMKTLGLDAQEFTNYLTEGIKNGSRNTDKLADALKETQIRIKAGDFNTAFDGLAKGATAAEKVYIDKMKSIATAAQQGKISIKDALTLSASAVTEGFDSGKISASMRDQLLIGLSGTPAEDIGGELYAKILKGFGKDKSGFAAEGEKASKAFEEAAKPKGFEGFKRAIEGLLGFIGDAIAPILTPITDILTKSVLPAIQPVLKVLGEVLGGILTPLGALIGELFVALTPLFDVLMKIVAAALKPIGKIIEALSPVISELVGVLVSVLVPILEELEPVIGDIVNIAAQLIIIWAKLFVAAIRMVESIGSMVAELLGFDDAGEMVTVVIRYMVKAIGIVVESLLWFYKGVEKVVDSIIGFVSAIGEFFGVIDKKSDKEKKSSDSTKKHSDMLEELTTSLKDTVIETDKTTDSTDKLGGSMDKTTKTVESAADKLARFRKELVGVLLAQGEFGAKEKTKIDVLAKQSQLEIDTKEAEGKLNSIIEQKRKIDEGTFFIPKSTISADSVIELSRFAIDEDGMLQEINSLNIPAPKLEPIIMPVEISEDVKTAELNKPYIEFAKGLAERLKNMTFELPDTVDNAKLDEETENLKKQLKNREISYQEYNERMNEIDSERAETSNQYFEMFKQVAAESFKFISDEFTAKAEKLKEDGAGVGDVLGSLGIAATAGLGAALAAGEDFGTAFLKTLLDTAIKAVSIYSVEIFGLISSLIPPPFGQIAAVGVIGSMMALLGVARAAVGAEGGVIGIDNNYNKKPGATDTIPVMLAKGEAVINARQTKKHSGLLNVINNGGDINRYLNSMSTANESEKIVRLEKLVQKLVNNSERNINVNDRRQLIITDKRTIAKNLPIYK